MKKISLLFILFLPVLYTFAETSQVIPPIVVKKKPFSLTSGTANVISQQDIITSGDANLSQVLQNLGGIQLQNVSANGNQVLLSLRGFGANASSNTLLLINGIPLVNPDLAPPDLNAIPLSQIKSIVIIAGSESVLYGDQAVG